MMNQTPGKWRQTTAAVIMCIGSLLIGVSFAWTSKVTQDLQKVDNIFGEKPLTGDQTSWLASAIFIGQLSAMLWGSNLCELLGRKKAAIVGAFVFITTWLLRLLATKFNVLLVGQLMEGVGDGLATLIIPIYITEVASDAIRGLLVSLFVLSMKSGYLFAFILSAVLPHKLMTGCTLIAPAVQLAGLLILPETPIYLIRKNRVADAKKSLMWFRGNDKTIVETELSRLQQYHRKITLNKSSFGIKDVFSDRTNLKGFMIAITMTLIQQSSGVTVMVLYVVMIFDQAKIPMEPHIASIIYACVHIFGCWLSTLMVDRFGRRPLLFLSTAGMAISHCTLGVFFTLQSLDFDVGAYNWLPMIAVNLYGFSYSAGVGPLAPVVSNEVINPQLTSICNSMQLVILSIISFLLMKLFPILTHVIGFQNCSFTFATTCAIGFLTILFIIPETKGKSLETIHKELQKRQIDDNETLEQMQIMSVNTSR